MEEFPRDKIPENPKILLIKLRSIGDVVFNTAVYTPLKRSFPDSHLTVLVESPSYDIVCDHPSVDEVLCFEKKNFLYQIGFYYRLLARRYDVVIDMHEGTRGAVMCFTTQAPFRVGHKFAKRSFCYNVKLSFADLQPRYPIDFQVALVKKMGVEFENISPAVHISESAKGKAGRLLAENGISQQDSFCIFHPGARVFDRWDAGKFAELADFLFSQYQLKILLTCGSGQEKLVEEIIKKIKKAPYGFITARLQELGAVTERAKFVVCHNGGYMHFADALGIPVIGMFGWANPYIWKPIGDRAIVIYKNLKCSPCNSKTIKQECLDGDPECKRLITVKDVVSAIESIYPPIRKADHLHE
ncbi:MAG: glycosyltransferase family 9 protein [Nitrospina sp.]|nr:glycosyltransferase family 9 protein [Nitrospina sp.]